ncbi:MAG: hypothetical protein LKF37_00050 [Lentilactobacillus diolivorans]|jgi:hypothetical protein|nr:hypothetical protein [Lentilactobacillus diolivorans]RRG00818.1 MAG: hypothetical protein DUD34_14215 [Lactobacillus sp.]
MNKIIRPTSKNIYLWGLLDFFCILSFSILSAFDVNESISKVILGLYIIIFLYSIFKTISGIIFSKFYDDGGILSVAFIEICFLILLLVMVV